MNDLLAQTAPRAKSLIVTVFGDAIQPHGGSVWLGSLIALLAPFGISERLVRTAVRRLTLENVLTRQSEGRRSYYGLTEAGRHRFEAAERRIYANASPTWNGRWCIIFLPADSASARSRDAARRELRLIGFGEMAPNVLLGTTDQLSAVYEVLQDLGLRERVVLLVTTTEDRLITELFASRHGQRTLVRQCWDLEALAIGYRDFVVSFRRIWELLDSGIEADPATAFRIRTLAIHEYRRILLRDPQLPDVVLPGDWIGHAARTLVRSLYFATVRPAQQHLHATLETRFGPLPAPVPSFYERFGGLDLQTARAGGSDAG